MKSQKQIYKKRLGQNFLIDGKVIQMMVEVADIKKDDVVIEIGAGTGNLTKAIAAKAGRVIAFEIDRDLVSILKENLRDFNNVEIVNQDILKSSLLSSFQDDTLVWSLLGSIPYSITSPLIHKVLFSDVLFKTIVLLIQLEVAEKISSQPPKASYLSNLVNSCGKAEIVQKVPSSSFQPQPKVDSAIIKIKKTKQCDKEFSDFLHQGFKHPRKMLRSKFNTELLESLGIDARARAQELKLNEWRKLFNAMLVTNGG